jgi:putative flippase GtrA
MLGLVKRFLQDKEKRNRFIRFGIIGFLGFLVNALCLELFRRTGVGGFFARFWSGIPRGSLFAIAAEPSAWAAALATEIAIISNFIFNNIWTFKDRKISSARKLTAKFLQFNATSFGAVIIQFLVIGVGTMLFSDTLLVRQLFLVISVGFFIVPYNWFMYNVVIWRIGKKGKNEERE